MPNEIFEGIIASLEKMRPLLGALTHDIEDLGKRSENVARRAKRNNPLRDDHLETDFAALLARIQSFAAEAEKCWTKAQDALRQINIDSGKSSEFAYLPYRQLSSRARMMNEGIDEFCSVYRYAHSRSKGLPFDVNWWAFDAACRDLSHISGRILFVVRELSKIAEAKQTPEPDCPQ